MSHQWWMNNTYLDVSSKQCSHRCGDKCGYLRRYLLFWVCFGKLCAESVNESKRNQTKSRGTLSELSFRFFSYLKSILIISIKASKQVKGIRPPATWIIWKFKSQWVWTVKCRNLFTYPSVCCGRLCRTLFHFFRVCVCKVQAALWLNSNQSRISCEGLLIRQGKFITLSLNHTWPLSPVEVVGVDKVLQCQQSGASEGTGIFSVGTRDGMVA